MNQTIHDDYHKKVCPLLVIDQFDGMVRYNANCIGSRCAWYDFNQECCTMLSLARSAARGINRK